MAQLLGGTRIHGNATVDSQLVINGTTSATSTDTGALVVAGGIGIGGSVYSPLIFENSARIVSTSTIKFYAATSVQNGTDTVVTLSTTTGQLTVWNTSTLQSITSRGATTDRAMTITNTTNATTTATGALQVRGGVGIGQNLYVGGLISVATITSVAGNITIDPAGTSDIVFGTGAFVKIQDTSVSSNTTSGALVVSGGMGVAEDIYVGGQIAVATITSISGDITIDPNGNSNVVFGTGAQVKILDITAASSTITGALVVSGGVGVAEEIYVGGQIYNPILSSISGDLTLTTNGVGDVIVQDTTQATSTVTGALQVVGGVGIGKDVFVGGLVRIQNSTDASNTTSGALVVTGGVGIGQNLHVGGQFSATVNVSTNPTIDIATPNSGVTGGLRVRGNATSGRAILQFASSTGVNWSTATVTSAGTMTYSDDLVVNGGIKFGSPQGSAIRHVTPTYTNGSQIFVTSTQPTASAIGDIWIQI